MKRKESVITKSYNSCKKTLFETKTYFVISILIFCLSLIIGFGLPYFFREHIIQLLKGLVDIFADKNVTQTILLIFYNNAKASLFSIIFGVFFGVFPFVLLVVNGYLVGFTARLAAEQYGMKIWLRLIPHGIFELPAIFISAGMGMKLGLWIFTKNHSFKEELKKTLQFYLLVILPLLFIAAIIEGILLFLMI